MSSNAGRHHPVASYPFSEAKDAHESAPSEQQQRTKNNVLESNLRQLKTELDGICDDVKSSFVQAQNIAPNLTCDQHLSQFLDVEGCNVKLAAQRIVNYWSHRHRVFGEDYTLPLTLSGAMKSHVHSLNDGFFNLLPQKDNFGRAIIYCSSKKLSPERSDNQIRVFWYLLHVAMEDDVARRKGFVIISNAKDSSLNNFDSKTTAAICTTGDRIFAIRFRQIHCCHTNPVFPLVASMVKAVLSVEQRESFVLHNGSCEQVLASLEANGIPKESLPTDLGGCIKVSPEIFLRERLAIENGFKSEEGDSSPELCMMRVENAMLPTVQVAMLPKGKEVHDDMKTAKKQVSSASKQSARPGRLGDPRMNAAVQAKLDNPDLPLLEALTAGGFVFEDVNKPGVKSSEVKDKDGVTVYQRRNQLLRRLRKERNRT